MPRYVTRPLSARRVQSVDKRGLYCDGGGLYLQVSKRGTKSWLFRFALNGRTRDMGLGSIMTFSLAEARERARKMRQLVADGIDPIDQRNATRGAASVKVLTFRECAEHYVAAHEAGWKNGGPDWLASLQTHAFPVFGELPVAAVELSHIMQALEPKWSRQPQRLGIVRGRIEQVLDWAKVRGYRHGENPAAWRGNLDALLPSRAKIAPPVHRAALPYREIGDFMVTLRGLGNEVPAAALEFAILTATRATEATGARWDEIDMAERVWTVTAERMKAKRDHRVPLSPAAIAVLERQAALRENDFVFPGQVAGQPINRDAPMNVVERLGLKGKVTAHGFRSAFRDWAAEQTNFPREVAEASLAHATGDATERAYQRSDFLMKRRQIMEAWSRYVATPAAKAGEVVSLHMGAKSA